MNNPYHVDGYNRRFRQSMLQVVPLDELGMWEHPERSPYNHMKYLAEYNFSFLFFLFKSLLKYEHIAVSGIDLAEPKILEKTLVIIYKNIDFFTGEVRLDV